MSSHLRPLGHNGHMDTYMGPGIVTADGTDYEVEADLVMTTELVRVRGGAPIRGLAEWHGTLDAQDEGAAWNIFDADDTSLRIGDRTGKFIATNSHGGSSEIVIKGSGPAPFGR